MERKYTDGVYFSDFAWKSETDAELKFDSAIEAYETICQKYSTPITRLTDAQKDEAQALYDKLMSREVRRCSVCGKPMDKGYMD